MATLNNDLQVNVTTSSDTAGLESTKTAVDNLGGSVQTTGGKLSTFGDTLKAILASQLISDAINGVKEIGEKIVQFGEDSIAAAEASQDSMAQITNEITNFGAQAPITAQGAEDIATKFAETTTNSKQLTLAAEEVLLKFDNMTSTTFPEAIQVTSDLAARLGEDMPTAAALLGRALENPTTATRALTAAGVEFTAAQKKVLTAASATGDVATADNLILTALGQNLSGASAAAASTFSGKIAILNNDFQIFEETVGNALIKGLTPFIDKIVAWSQTSQAQQTIQAIATWVGTMTTDMVNWVTQVAVPWVEQHWPAIQKAVQNALDVIGAIGSFLSTDLGKDTVIAGASLVVLGAVFNTFGGIALGALNPVSLAILGIVADAALAVAAINTVIGAINAENSLASSVSAEQTVTNQSLAGLKTDLAEGKITQAQYNKSYAVLSAPVPQSAQDLGFGITQSATSTSQATLNALGVKSTFSSGGYTGTGSPTDIAGVVHKGEYVVPKNQVDQRTGKPSGSGGVTIQTLNVYPQTYEAGQGVLSSLNVDSLLASKGMTTRSAA